MTTKTKRQKDALDVPKKVTDWIAKVRRTNKKFEQASPEQKRVLLAKDVLAAIAARRFNPSAGVFFTTFGDDPNRRRADHNSTLQSNAWSGMPEAFEAPAVMPLYGSACQVCAKGALFVSRLDRLNGLKLGELRNGDPSTHIREFTRYQLDLIESAFEMKVCNWGCVEEYTWDAPPENPNAAYSPELSSVTNEEFEHLFVQAANFCKDFSPKDRLRFIMANIVRNNGTFDPTQQPTMNLRRRAARPTARLQSVQEKP